MIQIRFQQNCPAAGWNGAPPGRAGPHGGRFGVGTAELHQFATLSRVGRPRPIVRTRQSQVFFATMAHAISRRNENPTGRRGPTPSPGPRGKRAWASDVFKNPPGARPPSGAMGVSPFLGGV